jgi:hypothetical protein
MPAELSRKDKEVLRRCEEIIDRGLSTFLDVGNALLTIRDAKLYTATHDTFEAYCRERWDFTARRARQLMEAAEVCRDLNEEVNKSGTMVPLSERQVRPLTALPPEERRDAWEEAKSSAPDGKVTGKHVQEVVDRKLGKSRVNGELRDDPPDVAALREQGRIAPDVVPEVTEPEPAPEPTAPGPPPTPTEAELSDEEWLATLPLREHLEGRPRSLFDADALLYRRLESPRKTFQHHATRMLNAARRKGEYGYRVSRFLRIDHPRHWLACPRTEDGGCGGSGQVPLIGDCPRCRGRGYWIK